MRLWVRPGPVCLSVCVWWFWSGHACCTPPHATPDLNKYEERIHSGTPLGPCPGSGPPYPMLGTNATLLSIYTDEQADWIQQPAIRYPPVLPHSSLPSWWAIASSLQGRHQVSLHPGHSPPPLVWAELVGSRRTAKEMESFDRQISCEDQLRYFDWGISTSHKAAKDWTVWPLFCSKPTHVSSTEDI